MIQPAPGKERYQVLMDHGLPGRFEFEADFAKVTEAIEHAGHLHAKYRYADIVVLDAQAGTLSLTLQGKRTLLGTTI